MAIAACFFTPSLSSSIPKLDLHRPLLPSSSPSPFPHLRLTLSPLSIRHQYHHNNRLPLLLPPASSSSGGGGDFDNLPPSGGGGGNNKDNSNNDNNDDNGEGDDDNAAHKNREEAMMVLAAAKRALESLPKDLGAAIQAGRIPGAVVSRFLDLEKSGLLRWLLQFGGFKERLLADDLFLAKVAMECGVGIFTKVSIKLMPIERQCL